MSKLQPFLGQDIKDTIKSLSVKSGTSKEGNTYDYLELELNNGFCQRLYINSSNEFGFLNALQNRVAGLNTAPNASSVQNSNIPF